MAKLSAYGSEITRLQGHVPSPEDPRFGGEDAYISLQTDGYVLGSGCFTGAESLLCRSSSPSSRRR